MVVNEFDAGRQGIALDVLRATLARLYGEHESRRRLHTLCGNVERYGVAAVCDGLVDDERRYLASPSADHFTADKRQTEREPFALTRAAARQLMSHGVHDLSGDSSDLPRSRFDFYEKVRVVSDDPSKAEIFGKLAAVLGKAKGDGGWSYGIHVYDSPRTWHCWEHELESTGDFDRRKSFYAIDSIRGIIDPRD
jgi:hypothetical protein